MLLEIFKNLDKWRNFPNYQLERRADIFFSLYLIKIIEQKYNVILKKDIIPEFPIKRSLIKPDYETNKSYKIDYICTTHDLSKTFFIELKTDSSSRNAKQDKYLSVAKGKGFFDILMGLKEIFLATNSKGKYFFLFKELSKLGFVEMPDTLNFKNISNELINQITIFSTSTEIELIYIQPKCEPDNENIIDFKYFSDLIIDKYDDEVSKTFARYLKKWIEKPCEDIR